MWNDATLATLQAELGHSFENIELLHRALTHRSWVEETNPGGSAPSHLSQQRLEFLGDAILDYTVARWLHRRLPEADEGELTRRRGDFVKADALASWGASLKLANLLRRGRGERAMASQNRRQHADTVEAVLGAVVIDGGEGAAMAVIERWLPDELPEPTRDPIQVVERWHHSTHHSPPPGPIRESDAAGSWTLVFSIHGHEATGTGARKRDAKRDAFRQLVALLEL